MQYTYVHILAAVFLLVGMGDQTVVSYRRVTRQVEEQIDLQMQLAQENQTRVPMDRTGQRLRHPNAQRHRTTRLL